MARSPDSQRVREWEQRMVRFDESPRSVVQFCRDEAVSTAAFYHWRKRLKTPVPRRPTAATELTDRANGGGFPDGFTPVRLIASESVTVRLPGGTHIDIPTTDPQVLQLAIETLAQTVLAQVDAQRQADTPKTAGAEPC